MSSMLKNNQPESLVPEEDILTGYKPRTELGRRLATLRLAIVESGEPMLDDNEIAEEVAERRGGFYKDGLDEQ